MQNGYPPLLETEQEACPGSPTGTRVELFLDSHCVAGELRYPGPPRRLVDILNAVESAIIALYNGELEGRFHVDEAPRRFPVIHVRRDAILLAVPRGGPAPRFSPFEAVAKVPVHATIVLPGFEVTGNVHLPPNADLTLASLLASGRFIPLTDATIVAAQQGRTWRGPIVVANLARAQVYASRMP